MKVAPLAVAAVLAFALVGGYAAAGGLAFKPSPVGDPCKPRLTNRGESGATARVEGVVLRAADGVACELGVSREELILSLRSVDRFEQLASDNGIEKGELEGALRRGLIRATDQAEEEGVIGGSTASALRAAAGVLPLELLLSIVRRGAGVLG
ncbi:MAG: hypothetical protein U0R50_17495 [Gaiellales bacterium]